MMGSKEWRFASLIRVSVEELVPQDHFYRHLERTLDLSFVREFVQQTYASGGRPSIDPVVFFKLQLVMFFEGIRSERQLMRHAADRLSVRWYVGYDLGEPLPDHSSLTRIRERYGVEVFRRFFEAIVEQCQQAGLVWGQELYFDGTKVLANASTDSVKPRFAVEAHLAHLFAPEAEASVEETERERTLLYRQIWSFLRASLPQWERFVKDDRAVKRPVRTSRIRRNDANFAIPQRAIELLGAIPQARIEHKQRSLTVTGDLFNHSHECSPDPPTTLT